MSSRPGNGPTMAGRVAVVTGGGGGIGAAVSLELAGRGAHVVVVDPGWGVEGEQLGEPTAAAVASRIRAVGGSGEASTVSVTDGDRVQALFEDVRRRLGSLDIVVNPAGIVRSRKLADGTEEDWAAVLGVHYTGYVNVLSAALPIMVEAGYGRLVGFTSGVGLVRSAGDALVYGAAKRAVAALTWTLAPMLPSGVTVNALSPIAATRMVRSTLAGGRASVGDLDLSQMPQPVDMAPAAAFLCEEEAGWWRGRVIFSAGSELSVIEPPRLLEAVRTEGVRDYKVLLDTVIPVVLAPAEAEQRSGGGSNPRFGDVFSGPADQTEAVGGSGGGCLIAGDDQEATAVIAGCVSGWGLRPVRAGVAGGDMPEGLTAVVVTSGGPAAGDAGVRDVADHWHRLLDAQRAAAARIASYGSWLRAAARYSTAHNRPIRVVLVSRGADSSDEPEAQGVAQLARSANDATLPFGIQVFSVRVVSTRPGDLEVAGQLIGRLIAADDAIALKGAELVVGQGWLGVRSHPAPLTTVSFGGGPFPMSVGEVLRTEVG